jgi:IS30 family transposase
MSEINNNTNQNKKQYTHLSYGERVRIEVLYKNKKSIREIAKDLKRSPSTILKELERGTVEQMKSNRKTISRYFANVGQRVYKENRTKSVAKGVEKYSANFFKMLKLELKNSKKIKNKLLREHSVDTFVHTYKKKNPTEKVPCTKTVYNLIEAGKLDIINLDLPRKVKIRPRKSKASRPKGTNKKKLGKSIDERCESVLERKEIGHWEADFVKGKKDKGEAALLTLVERKTRNPIVRKLNNFEASTALEALKKIIEEIGVDHFKSITFDNGSEFSEMKKLEELDVEIYFAHAYSSWERGSNENFNGLIREFIPKGISINIYTDEEVQEIQDCLRKRPRRILGYLSSEEAYKLETA